MRILPVVALSLSAVLMVGCDALGIESGTVTAERKEAEGKAIGSACRHALRAIEDCYTLNAKASKSAVFAGWREMDEYMRENKLEGIVPVVPRKGAKPAVPASNAEGEEASRSEGGADAGHADKTEPSDKGSAPDARSKREAGAEHDPASRRRAPSTH